VLELAKQQQTKKYKRASPPRRRGESGPAGIAPVKPGTPVATTANLFRPLMQAFMLIQQTNEEDITLAAPTAATKAWTVKT